MTITGLNHNDMLNTVAGLVERGLTFETRKGDDGHWVITLSGGY